MTRHSNKQKNKNKKTKDPTTAHKKEKSQYFEMEPETTQKIKLTRILKILIITVFHMFTKL